MRQLSLLALIAMLAACRGVHDTPRITAPERSRSNQAEYHVSGLAELAAYSFVRPIGLDGRGDMLALVAGGRRPLPPVSRGEHAVLDVNPGTKHAKVIPLLPPNTYSSTPIAMSTTGTVLLSAGIPYVGTLHERAVYWHGLPAKPWYGTANAVGLAADDAVAGTVDWHLLYPHCCRSFQRAVVWVPHRGGYGAPILLSGTNSTATAVWSGSRQGKIVVAGTVGGRLALWSYPSLLCLVRQSCSGNLPVLGASPHDELLSYLTGSGRRLYGTAEAYDTAGSLPFGELMPLIPTRSGGFGPGVYQPIRAPKRYPNSRCASGPWAVTVERHAVLTAVGGLGCWGSRVCHADRPLRYGYGCAMPPPAKAVIWRHGRSTLLDQLIPSGAHWRLMDATAINPAGDIAGIGRFGHQTVPFLLKPRH